jgi:hypothetical protein
MTGEPAFDQFATGRLAGWTIGATRLRLAAKGGAGGRSRSALGWPPKGGVDGGVDGDVGKPGVVVGDGKPGVVVGDGKPGVVVGRGKGEVLPGSPPSSVSRGAVVGTLPAGTLIADCSVGDFVGSGAWRSSSSGFGVT